MIPMDAQGKSMKISSRIRETLEAQRQPGQKILLRPSDMREAFMLMDEVTDRAARVLLVELLNLSDNPQRIQAVRQQFRRVGITSEETLKEDSELLRLRDELRGALESPATQLFPTIRRLMEPFGPFNHSLPSSDFRNVYVLDWGESRPGRQDWLIWWGEGLIRPMPDSNFRGTVGWGLLRLATEIAYCKNPECPAPYYLRRRRDQKYCTANDECARFAGRQAARRYWHSKGQKKGKQRRKPRQKGKPQ